MYDELIDQIRTETDLEKRAEMMHQAEDILMETGAIMPLYFYTDIYLQKDYLTNVYWTPFGYKYFMFAELNNPAADADNTTLHAYLASEPDKLDPALNSTVTRQPGHQAHLLAGLFTYNADHEQIPDLVDTYEVMRGRHDLHLHPEGRPEVVQRRASGRFRLQFTARQPRRRPPDRLPTTATCSLPIKGYDEVTEMDADGNRVNPDAQLAVSASEDGKTLTVELSFPCAYFLDLCAFPTYFPVYQEAVEAADPEGTTPAPGLWRAPTRTRTSSATALTF